MKSFKHWYFQEVEETFGIVKVDELEPLSKWMEVDVEDIAPAKKDAIEKLRTNLLKYVNYWNEAEVGYYFLSPFLMLVDVQKEEYRGFWERSLSVSKGGEVASGIIDFMIARGKQLPKSPYFFINEFKPETGTSNDPIGQLLMGMLAAQQQNEQENYPELTVYGAYTIGRNWYFVVLAGNQYAVSDAFTATQADIYAIFKMLEKV
ncbi:MAG: hypothetical protein AAF806_32675, partial [Bacteroidota bacterium]